MGLALPRKECLVARQHASGYLQVFQSRMGRDPILTLNESRQPLSKLEIYAGNAIGLVVVPGQGQRRLAASLGCRNIRAEYDMG